MTTRDPGTISSAHGAGSVLSTRAAPSPDPEIADRVGEDEPSRTTGDAGRESRGRTGGNLVLGIDTSSVVCAGLAADGEAVASLTVPDTRAHAEQLTPLVRQLLADAGVGFADLGSVAVGMGPGPFTGLRVGVAAAAVLAEVLQVPIKGVCSLDVLASQAVADGVVPGSRPFDGLRAGRARPPDDPSSSVEPARTTGDFVVATDARRKEWYWAIYSADGSRVAGPFVTAPDGLPDLPRIGPVTDTPIGLDAGRLAALAAVLPDAGLEPLYLRRPDAEVPTTRKSTLLPPRLAARRTR